MKYSIGDRVRFNGGEWVVIARRQSHLPVQYRAGGWGAIPGPTEYTIAARDDSSMKLDMSEGDLVIANEIATPQLAEPNCTGDC